jgi:YD repeat-containing protein
MSLRKGINGTYYSSQNYWFRVVPYGTIAGTPSEAVLDSCYPYMPTFDNRTVRVNDEDRDTTHAIGEFAGHSMTAVLDEAALDVSVTDLAIATWGPDAAISRSYDSDDTAVHMLANAPGWRFDFERSIETTTGGAAYTDETGEVRRFTLSSGVYHAPNGCYDTLTLASGQWTLMHKDRTREVFDATTGKLLSVIDKHDNTTSYTWGENQLTITAENNQALPAENDQAIDVALSAGKVASATYATADGTRAVHYATSGPPTVTYFEGDAECEYDVVYGYDGTLLTSITVPDYPEVGTDAAWEFGYGPDRCLTHAYAPAHSDDSHAYTEITWGTDQATVTTYGDVTDTSNWTVAQDAGIDTHYTWNPTGTMSTMVDPHRADLNPSAPHATWSYAYSQANEAVSETSPTGKLVKRTFDLRGNATSTTDENGARVTYTYDALDQLTQMIDERLCTTNYTYYTAGYGGTGEIRTEQRQLTLADKSETRYEYDSAGRMTKQEQKITRSPETWAITQYGDFAPSGESQETTQVGVLLAYGGTAEDLEQTRTFDALGNATHEYNALEQLVSETEYDIAGRAVRSEDASGVATITEYDKLGNTTLTYREAPSGTWSDRSERTYDTSGRVASERYYTADASQTPVLDRSVIHVYDASGRETKTDDTKVAGETRTRYDARGNTVQNWAEGSDLATNTASARSIYDTYGQLATEYAPGAETSATVYTYLPNGLTSRVDNPDGSYTEYTYDAGGLKLTETVPTQDAEPAGTTYSYDVGGRLVSSTNAEGATTASAYDLLDRQVSAAAGDQSASTTVYNTAGWVIREVDSDGVVKAKTYDKAGRVQSETRVGTGSTSTYNAAEQLLTTVNGDGSHVAYGYDALGRPEREQVWATDGSLVRDTTTTYDAAGRVESATDAVSGRTWSFTYNTNGSTTVAEEVSGRTISRTTDSTGLLVGIDADVFDGQP